MRDDGSLTFKAAILEKINSPLIVSEVETTDLRIGQVLVKVLISGLCGAQLQEIRGEKGNEKFTPHLLGHEGCGIVERVGPGVTKVKAGDKVIMHWRKGDGIESPFPTYRYKEKTISSGKITTLSEYSIASENRLTPVPQSAPNELCALLGCGLSTAFGIINNDAIIKFGETVLVLGCGGVGLNVIMAANLASAGSVYGIDISEEKKALVEEFGGKFINNQGVITEKIDCIIDTTGRMDVVSEYLPLLSSRGRCIIVSQPKENSLLTFKVPQNLFAGNGQVIRTTQGGSTNPSDDFIRYINLYNKGSFNINSLITHNFKLDQINTAIDLLKDGKAGRILIKM
jgi:Zn-dependent alcohol dehydrogenase